MNVWWIIGALGLGTYLTRFVFLGLIGDRPMPDWVLRHLRYTGVAVLPGLVAPLVVWPEGGTDPAQLIAAAVTVAVGVWRKDVISAVLAGGAAFVALGLLS
ncbi:MAG: AzlD domain-containing protein [Pseudomonadota bacterium]